MKNHTRFLHPKSVSRRRFLHLAGTAVVGAAGSSLLAPPGAARAAASPSAAPATKNPITIAYWNHQHPPLIDFLKAKMELYRQKNPNVSFDFQFAPNKDHLQKLAVAMGTGTGPDLFNLHSAYTLGYQSKKLLAVVPPESQGYKSYSQMRADFLPGALDGLTFDGKVYGVPMQSNAFSLFLNKKHFQEAGLDLIKDAPRTWDDIARVGKRLVKTEGGRMTRKGFDFGYMLPTWIMYQVQPIIQQFGGDILDAKGGAAVSSPQAIKALQMMQDLLYLHRVGDPTITANSGSNPNEDFVQGKLSMWLTGPWAIETFKPNPEVYQNYTVVPHPQVDPRKPITAVYGFNLCVNSSAPAEKQAVAWDFIRFLTADPIEWMNKLAFPIPRKKWYEAAEAQQFPHLKVFIDDIAHGRALVKSVRFDEIIASIERAVQRIMLNKGNVKEALDLAASEINKAVAG